MSSDFGTSIPSTLRSVELSRIAEGVYLATNGRGGTVRFGSHAGEAFTPVELLLAAIAGCSAVDVDTVTARRATADEFGVDVTAHKARDEGGGSVLRDIEMTFTLRFPEGDAGDAARALLSRAAKVSHDRSCTVSRTIESGVPVSVWVDDGSGPVKVS
jgi:uncharacterized OsmC-like protein